MEIITKHAEQTYEMPEKLTPHNVFYYSHYTKEVTGSVKTKARNFLDKGLVEWDAATKQFYVNPVEGYNTRRYSISNRNGGFECNCQGCQTKIKNGKYNPSTDDIPACSHILAVLMFLQIEEHNDLNKQGDKTW